jgi:predicted adenine nucleotide alpha hydrolase (AANH) superfamily ATPase
MFIIFYFDGNVNAEAYMPVNYQKAMEESLSEIARSGETPKLLLHSCCGPCSSYVLEYLSAFFDITILYFNPNIWPPEEFQKRAETQRQLVSGMVCKKPVRLVIADYRPEEFDAATRGLESEPEGGERCLKCFALRLEEAARYAQAHRFDYFTTTLSVSPHKDAEALNTIGRELEKQYSVRYLYADFKKRDGYKRSIELSRQFGLYRQDYCGCRYSMAGLTIEQ